MAASAARTIESSRSTAEGVSILAMIGVGRPLR